MRLYLLTVYQMGNSHRFLVLAESLAEAIRLVSEEREFIIPGESGTDGRYTFTLNAEILPCRAPAILQMDAGVIGSSPWRPDE